METFILTTQARVIHTKNYEKYIHHDQQARQTILIYIYIYILPIFERLYWQDGIQAKITKKHEDR
jgi:hypothetical protein